MNNQLIYNNLFKIIKYKEILSKPMKRHLKNLVKLMLK